MHYASVILENAGHKKLLTHEMEKALLKNLRGDLWEK